MVNRHCLSCIHVQITIISVFEFLNFSYNLLFFKLKYCLRAAQFYRNIELTLPCPMIREPVLTITLPLPQIYIKELPNIFNIIQQLVIILNVMWI